MSALSFLAAADERPDAPALVVDGRPVSYRENAGAVRSCIGWLEERGIDGADADVRVALVPRADAASVAFIHALVELGVPMVLLHPRLTSSEREELLARVDSRIVVDGGPAESELASAAGVASREVAPERALAILFTSGTSGAPKAAVLSRRAFLASAEASAANLGGSRDERWLLAMPPAHVGGLSIITRMLVARGAVVLPAPGGFDPAVLVEILSRDRITLLSLVPTMLARLLSELPDWRPPPTLRALLLGGAPASVSLLRESRERDLPLLATYGLTEACSQVTTQRPTSPPSVEAGSGHPLPGVEVRVVEGAIEVRGETLFDGYLEGGVVRSKLDEEGWFATGDLGALDAEGRLHVHARRSDLILSGGENVYPAEVERALEAIDGVRAACVFGVEDEEWGQRVAALLVPSGAEILSNEALRSGLDGLLAGHKRPRLVHWVPRLPTNRLGKIDRREASRSLEGRLETL